ncbi:MATE family efflux transporter [Sulfurimonas sp.]|uniref:MATE family efflux transporter n=1 Tax=Sulfurimonas sp. TaxID=2022749 RepID=UPI002AB30D91|nr:MATE family efflux transporter [Sulfurimonas sp.]
MHIDLTQGVIKDHIVKLAVPAVIGYFFHTMFNVTDTIFAGMISTQALAALSLSASIFFMVLAIGIGMSEAVTSIIGNALGKKDIAKAQQVLLNSLVFATLLSIVLAIVGIFSVPYLIDALGDPSYTKETLEYINIILYGSIFFVGSFFLNAILTATGDTVSFRNILIFTAFLNIFLDYIFIKVFSMGVSAIALATIISEAITLIYLFYKVRKTKLWCGFSELIFDIKHYERTLKTRLSTKCKYVYDGIWYVHNNLFCGTLW